ncbi:hypothetical protein HanRHA438_Chr17g0789361 [Helianthus annuus]|nr:hypothetical protein HanRHA438_Chr17g0789361 [Helianthus annuus]
MHKLKVEIKCLVIIIDPTRLQRKKVKYHNTGLQVGIVLKTGLCNHTFMKHHYSANSICYNE